MQKHNIEQRTGNRRRGRMRWLRRRTVRLNLHNGWRSVYWGWRRTSGRRRDGRRKIDDKERAVAFNNANAELALQRKLGLEPFEYELLRGHAFLGLLNP